MEFLWRQRIGASTSLRLNSPATAANNKPKNNLLWWRYQFHEKWPKYRRDFATLCFIIILFYFCKWIRFTALALYDFQFVILRRLVRRTTQNIIIIFFGLDVVYSHNERYLYTKTVQSNDEWYWTKNLNRIFYHNNNNNCSNRKQFQLQIDSPSFLFTTHFFPSHSVTHTRTAYDQWKFWTLISLGRSRNVLDRGHV